MTETEKNEKETIEALHPSIGEEVNLFIQDISSLAISLPRAMSAVVSGVKEADARFNKYAEDHANVVQEEDGKVTYKFKPPYDSGAARLSKELANASGAIKLVPRTFVLTLIGQFDAFLGRLVKAIFVLKPETIENSERSISLRRLLEFETREAAIEHLLDKEIEQLLRKSHFEQFKSLEERFGLKLRKGLESWPTFIELTERRNLFAHTNGVVSNQYLKVCRDHKVKLPDDCAKGASLDVTPDYFNRAYKCVFEIGVKLAHVIWRKTLPAQRDLADGNLISVTFDLLNTNDYELACGLLNFGCTVIKKFSSDWNKRVMIINRAQAYKWAGDEEKCLLLVNDEDWSSCGLEFQLAIAVLRDQFNEAAELMRSIGNEGVVKKAEYQDWPIFKEFRKSPEFDQAYRDVFNEPFVHIEKEMEERDRSHLKEMIDKIQEQIERVSILLDEEDDE